MKKLGDIIATAEKLEVRASLMMPEDMEMEEMGMVVKTKGSSTCTIFC
jgi:hypothetical protein